jgi:hypothetical protein
VTSLLLVSFLVGVGYALSHGINLENCGCFTVQGDGRAAGLGLIGGDIALLAAAMLLAAFPPRTGVPPG